MRKGFKTFYIIKLALKNIFGHKLRSFLTILGVAVGIGFIVLLVSLGYGLQKITTDQIANLDALSVIDATPSKSKIIKVNDETIDKFGNLSNVQKVSPVVNITGNIKYESAETDGVIYGKNSDYLDLEGIQLVAGTKYSSNSAKEVVLNTTTLKRLSKLPPERMIGQEVTVDMFIGGDYFAEADAKPVGKTDKFKVVGILKNEGSPYVYVPLDAFRFYGVKNYNGAKIKVANRESVDNTKLQLENLGFRAQSLKETVDQINQFFLIFQFILLSFGAIAVIIASIGMFNTLTISLLEKTREISFMKVLGTTSYDIWKLFLWEAVMLGFIGTGFGMAGGYGVCRTLNNILITWAIKTNNKPIEIFYTPLEFMLIIIGVSLLISFLTGIYPSIRASRIDPLEALRYE